ncbi:MAG: hypothetical protein NZ956_01605 [Candidatus Caldarchaeum sp.]|nr:hypothetical protein [Candidatus Caldarchaeum sp.]
MVYIDERTHLEKFRQFIILNTCASYMPAAYLHDTSVFPERDAEHGTIYVEAVSKVPLREMRDVKFVKVAEVLGVIYKSKSGNTDLKWRQLKGPFGRVTGEASPNSVVNLLESGVLRKDYLLKKIEESAPKAEEGTG